eukprot:Awhi_evm1s4934
MTAFFLLLLLSSFEKTISEVNYQQTNNGAIIDLPQSNNSIPLYLAVDQTSAYLAEIFVGTPPQRQMVQVDTGSTFLWFVSSNPLCKVYPVETEGFPMETTDKMSCSPSNLFYNKTASSTFALYGDTYTNQGYGSDDNCSEANFDYFLQQTTFPVNTQVASTYNDGACFYL